MTLNKVIKYRMEFGHKKPFRINCTLFTCFSKLFSLLNFLPINNKRSMIYITSFVAIIEIVFPERPALAVRPDLCIKILGFGGKSY